MSISILNIHFDVISLIRSIHFEVAIQQHTNTRVPEQGRKQWRIQQGGLGGLSPPYRRANHGAPPSPIFGHG
uniref:Uncharacterized protein n=1 Tax=Arundo donax TaxID=35708 RepID=A0A0A9DDH6_ARUDO